MGQFKSKAPRTGFNRPTSTASEPVDREWRDVYAKDLVEGDIVAGKGLITEAIRNIRPFVLIEAGHPNALQYKLYELDIVKAFVRKDS
jgi:hypothetical protein